MQTAVTSNQHNRCEQQRRCEPTRGSECRYHTALDCAEQRSPAEISPCKHTCNMHAFLSCTLYSNTTTRAWVRVRSPKPSKHQSQNTHNFDLMPTPYSPHPPASSSQTTCKLKMFAGAPFPSRSMLVTLKRSTTQRLSTDTRTWLAGWVVMKNVYSSSYSVAMRPVHRTLLRRFPFTFGMGMWWRGC